MPRSAPSIRVPKPLSHRDFHPLYAECERLDVAIGIHGAPGAQLAGGSSDQLDTFTLVHVFANRSMQQMALAKLIFDGVLEAFPRLRVGIGSPRTDAARHVLARFTPKERVEIEIAAAEAAEAILDWLQSGDLEGCMTRFHSRWNQGA